MGDLLMSDFFDTVILFLLGLDSVRMIVAILGIVKPTSKYSWLIYGRYDINIMERALIQLGYSVDLAKEITKDISALSKKVKDNSGINAKNASEKLIVLLSKYITYFKKPINYGGKSISKSLYYINTMEISHNENDLNELTAIMLNLMIDNNIDMPDFIIVPKGGNLLFAQAVAKYLKAELIVVKDNEDKSTVIAPGQALSEAVIRVNFEGSYSVLNKSKNSKKKLNGYLVDCNTSGGTQLLSAIKKFNEMIDTCNLNISKPQKAFVLFRADKDKGDIDQKFHELNCKLYRYFDLDEESKGLIYKAASDAKTRKEQENIDTSSSNVLNYYIKEDKELVDNIIAELKRNSKFYYGGNTNEH